jgi:sporulation protein YlmC with PRC-barrel domain
MKALICYATIAVVVGVAARMSGQNEVQTGSSTNSGYLQTSKLIGRKVKSSKGKEIGVIKDIVLDRNTGCMAYTVIATGGEGTGITSGGGKIVAVPWAVYSLTSDLTVLTVSAAREKIFNAPAFDYTRMDEYARPDYIDNIYSYYGVSPGPPTAGSAGTDVTGTAGATASPGDVASATAGTGSQNAKPSARTHDSSVANSDAAPKENRSTKGMRSVRTIGASPLVGGEKSLSESATGTNKNQNSQRKVIESISARRPSATPDSADGQD